jgi:hypothetical protein
VGAQIALTTAALVVLNASLTFTNIWPTLGVWWNGGLSIDLALLVLALAFVQRRRGALSERGVKWIALAWVALVIARYVDVTMRSLFGRAPSLYWDLQFVPDVSAMFAVVASTWWSVAFISALIVVPLVVFMVSRWALARLVAATARRAGAVTLVPAAFAVGLAAVLQAAGVPLPSSFAVADSASLVYAAQVSEMIVETSGYARDELPDSPAIQSDFSRTKGADVLLLFLESYGAASWERPELASALEESRARLDADIRESGRSIVSAMVESTTFGGQSWLTHLTLLSGVPVSDPGVTLELMAQPRDTLVKAFGRAGYRTVAVMPGLLTPWPEGAFYGFDTIYDHARLDYQGPPFGWWDINDQFALARVDALEVEPRDRQPVFIVLPTITTHAPFTPAPPYQPDWTRVLGDQPYDAADLDRAWSDQPDWTDLAPSYVRAMAYAHSMVGGYLRRRAGHDLVMILVGDHQPPALVSGEGASWNVPVHVITHRRDILDRLLARDFTAGLAPGERVLTRMDGLLPILLDAFGD